MTTALAHGIDREGSAGHGESQGASSRVRLAREFTFEAAHRLPQAPPGHKCRRLHGHSFRIELICEGEIDAERGWLVDYGQLKSLFQPLHDELDHSYLNDVPGLENPTAENIARWVWSRLKPNLDVLSQINVFETCHARCEYRG